EQRHALGRPVLRFERAHQAAVARGIAARSPLPVSGRADDAAGAPAQHVENAAGELLLGKRGDDRTAAGVLDRRAPVLLDVEAACALGKAVEVVERDPTCPFAASSCRARSAYCSRVPRRKKIVMRSASVTSASSLRVTGESENVRA